jgi:uncharacterized protein (DUF433 family)
METATAETAEQLETPIAPGIVRRSDRGLCIAGTKVSLFSIMDSIKAGATNDLLRYGGLSQEQLDQALAYIEANRAEFEAAYEDYVQAAAEMEQHYREQERQRRAELDAKGLWKEPAPDLLPAWERLQALKRAGKAG